VGIATALWLRREPTAVVMFGLVAFVLAALGQELWRGVRARRAMSGGSVPVALVALVRRNRRRYGGYLVHAGMAVLFLGIAASSSFQDERDVRLSTGQSTRVGGYDVTYVRPTAKLVTAQNGRLERIDLGADLRLSRGGKTVSTLHTHKSYFPSAAPMFGAVSRFFEGDATSEVGLRAGLGRDVWSAVSPDTERLRPVIKEGDKVFAGPGAKLSAADREMYLAQTLRGLTAKYTDNPPAATFRLLVSPMVQWIWIGALIVFAGGLIAIWPAPRAARARATYAARVGREAREMARI
jgi:cytochrome c-type biogenesis protein CcmF